MSELTGIWSLTPLGALVGVLVMISFVLLRGYFIPRSSHERELELSNKRGDEWKETAVSVRSVNSELLRQNGDLIESNRITDHFFRAIGGNGSEVDTTTKPTRGDDVAK
jgi:hypothetical protein